jgi:hypothetical protein
MSEVIAWAIMLLIVGSMAAFIVGTNDAQLKRCASAEHSFVYCVRTTWGK